MTTTQSRWMWRKRWNGNAEFLQLQPSPQEATAFRAILMGSGCTGTGVSISKSNEVSDSSESWGMAALPTSAGVVANVPRRRDGSVGPIKNIKGRGFMKTEIEHFVYIIYVFVVLIRVFFFIIGYAMRATAIHSTIANVPEGLSRVGLTLTAKRKRMLATNLKGEGTIGCTSFTYSKMAAITNGTATSSYTNVLLCVLLFPHHVCKQQLTSIFSF
jgi:hypothetical protein